MCWLPVLGWSSCLSWLWCRIIPWLHQPFRLNFVIKIESPKGLLKLLLDPKYHPRAAPCWWVPGVLLCGQPICQTWADSRLGSEERLLLWQPAAAVGPGIGDRGSAGPSSIMGCCQLLTRSHLSSAASWLPAVHCKGAAREPCSLRKPVLRLSC